MTQNKYTYQKKVSRRNPAKVLVPLLVIVRCGVTAAAGWQLANVCNDTGKSSAGAAGVYIIRRDNVDTQLGVSGHSADRS